MLLSDHTASLADEPPMPRAGDAAFVALDDAAFKAALVNVLPHLRAFARSLVGLED